MLSGPEIVRQRELGRIHIAPFVPANVGPNSYDVTLSADLVTMLPFMPYDEAFMPNHDSFAAFQLDMEKRPPSYPLHIEDDGLVLLPGHLYLGATNESVCSNSFVPCFDGRSSIGRLGIFTHVTAGFGDVGWGYDSAGVPTEATWTLEIYVVYPIRVYAGRRIGQVFFSPVEGDLKMYSGKYTRQRKPQASLLCEDK